ncbi:MAG: MCE family protein [Deltaproteobacteria bacterium]|nr:MCE family protein [Deltaproteobacteria bacterium]
MSKQANKTMIGAFVVGAVALVIAGVLAFGSGKFLKETETYVMYFDGSVKGLDVGASVLFQGVKLGTVTNIFLRSDADRDVIEIPVFIELEADRVTSVGGKKRGRTPRETVDHLVARGMRAQLQMQSLVTGKLMIELDLHPDTPVRLVGSDPDYPEIPTIQTGLQELAKKIEKAPIEEIFEKLHSAVSGIEKVVNSPEVMELLRAMNDTLDDVEKLVEDVNSYVDPLLMATTETVRDAQKLVRNADNRVGTLASSADGAIKAAAVAVEQAQVTLKSVEKSAGDDSILYYELNKTLEELSGAARSIRLLADYLNQHPESLLRGKGGSR